MQSTGLSQILRSVADRMVTSCRNPATRLSVKENRHKRAVC